MSLQSLQLIYERLLAQVQLDYYRDLYNHFNIEQRLTGLVGPRGVGKTTLMLQYIKNNFAIGDPVFYFAADHFYFNQTHLYYFVEDLYLRQGVQYFFIDEIHKYPNWDQELKNLYDSFPDIYIVFSGSSSLDLIKGGYDLSRRAKLYRMAGLSFREYLNFYAGQSIDPVSFASIVDNPQQFNPILA